ncbi:hypothetical protein CWM53_01150 [Klebsiella sp. A-Nf5]|uniref:GTP pyrophosphokinase n=1 Tax=unclassified Klebsiella TaxID=2608929 RepID=UPI000C2AB87A|nr:MULTISPECIES: hypothetical protein [unclassified Klebsiella]HCA9583317.1 hypothetical protein [Klebsiella pneumoniae]PJX34114.1 hypothetical protein CWM53_01150 [Klebsiella sp. A-Nf5]PJX35266.1 hypothetical protein CWM59_23350 [Klebsiella sp. B-Nf7]PJX46014.1 hypothetical protein CWM60_23415 [Klebsiella sp. C1-16S-Nf17]HCA9586730.1 hypothetical protein [Klebsiella pneumoniae]
MNDILSAYDEQKNKYESYALSLTSLLKTLILDTGASVHSLDYRIKDRNSLEKKIIDKDKYEDISEITDIVGIRIITYYSDDVDKVAKLLEQEFIVDTENSIDKRTSLEPDRFGYLSLHYIVSLNENRTCLREYVPYKSIKAEIQIRSILQHAWAEIEHDLGYKTASGLPNEIRRYFSRLAGLLELADDEFIKIKKAISARQKDAAKKIEQGGDDALLDAVFLKEYINKSKVIDEIASDFSELYKINVTGTSESVDKKKLLDGLTLLNIKTIKQLDELLISNRKLLYKRIGNSSKMFMDLLMRTGLSRDAIILYAIQIGIVNLKSEDIEDRFFRVMGYKNNSLRNGFFNNIRKTITDD